MIEGGGGGSEEELLPRTDVSIVGYLFIGLTIRQ